MSARIPTSIVLARIAPQLFGYEAHSACEALARRIAATDGDAASFSRADFARFVPNEGERAMTEQLRRTFDERVLARREATDTLLRGQSGARLFGALTAKRFAALSREGQARIAAAAARATPADQGVFLDALAGSGLPYPADARRWFDALSGEARHAHASLAARLPPASPAHAAERTRFVATSATDDLIETIDRAVSIGDRPMRDYPQLIATLLDEVAPGSLEALTISGHGAAGAQRLSLDQLSLDMTPAGPRIRRAGVDYEAELALLRPLFARGATVYLGGCEVAGGELGPMFLRRLAHLLGVEVRASDARQRPLIPGVEGHEVACRTDGACESTGVDAPLIVAERYLTGPDADARRASDLVARARAASSRAAAASSYLDAAAALDGAFPERAGRLLARAAEQLAAAFGQRLGLDEQSHALMLRMHSLALGILPPDRRNLQRILRERLGERGLELAEHYDLRGVRPAS